jgi:molybdate transport system ATP-binding protein
MLTLAVTKPLHGTDGAMTLDVDLAIEEGSFVAVAGPSGSGKTTLLRIIAGLEDARGRIVVGDEVWLDGERSVAPQARGIGLVFQDFALFANMTVEGNLLYVAQDKALAERLLEMTDLIGLRDRYPETLSGGQKQRVALARALMRRPKVLLLDEPLSALDPTMRAVLRAEIMALHREFGTTTLMVSHDEREIAQMADRVVRLEQGRIVADGAPEAYTHADRITGEYIAYAENGAEVTLTLRTAKGVLEVVAHKP